MRMTNNRKKLWILAASLGGLLLLGSIGAGVVYWQYFRKDPQFLEEQRQSEQLQQEIDELFADDVPGDGAGAEG